METMRSIGKNIERRVLKLEEASLVIDLLYNWLQRLTGLENTLNTLLGMTELIKGIWTLIFEWKAATKSISHSGGSNVHILHGHFLHGDFVMSNFLCGGATGELNTYCQVPTLTQQQYTLCSAYRFMAFLKELTDYSFSSHDLSDTPGVECV